MQMEPVPLLFLCTFSITCLMGVRVANNDTIFWDTKYLNPHRVGGGGDLATGEHSLVRKIQVDHS